MKCVHVAETTFGGQAVRLEVYANGRADFNIGDTYHIPIGPNYNALDVPLFGEDAGATLLWLDIELRKGRAKK